MSGDAWVIDGKLCVPNEGRLVTEFPEIEYEIMPEEPRGVSAPRYVRDRTRCDWLVGWVLTSPSTMLAVAWQGQGRNQNARENGG